MTQIAELILAPSNSVLPHFISNKLAMPLIIATVMSLLSVITVIVIISFFVSNNLAVYCIAK